MALRPSADLRPASRTCAAQRSEASADVTGRMRAAVGHTTRETDRASDVGCVAQR